MSKYHPNRRVKVWVQKFKDRDSLMLQWIDPDTGKRKSQSAETSNMMMAEARAGELEYEINHGLHQEASNMSWEKFRELFEAEYISGKRPGTRKNYADTFALFARLCNPGSLRSISERTLSQFVSAARRQPGRPGKGMQDSTIKVRLNCLKAAMKRAKRQKLIAECPSFPKVTPLKRKPRAVATELVERLLEKAPDENMYMFLQSAWLAGLRMSEAMALEWEETENAPYIDFARQRIVFPAGFVKAAEDQWVPLDPGLRNGLLRLPRQERKVFRLVTVHGGRMERTTVGSRIAKIARQVNVRLTMKSLRAGFACYWASRVEPQVLQKLMRHSSIQITLDYYANVDHAAMRAVLERPCNTLGNKWDDGNKLNVGVESTTSEEKDGYDSKG